jgi:lysophospholipase L1-like esterase
LSLFVVFYYLLFYFNGNYPNPKSFLNNLTSQEDDWIEKKVQELSQDITDNYKDTQNDKIMIIGSSQTWGAGASDENKSFPRVFEQKLNNMASSQNDDSSEEKKVLGISTENEISVINAGISGTTSSRLLDEYQEKWIQLNPKVVMINLSSNDFTYENNAELFTENIRKFIEINNDNNIKTILLAEANSNERISENPLHLSLKELSVEYNIPIIDINSHLNDMNNTGVIWWDFVHPTDYGHELIADYILKNVIDLDLDN